MRQSGDKKTGTEEKEIQAPVFSPEDRGDTLTLERWGLLDWVGSITSNCCDSLLSFLCPICLFLAARAFLQALEIFFVMMPPHGSDNNNSNAAMYFK